MRIVHENGCNSPKNGEIWATNVFPGPPRLRFIFDDKVYESGGSLVASCCKYWAQDLGSAAFFVCKASELSIDMSPYSA